MSAIGPTLPPGFELGAKSDQSDDDHVSSPPIIGSSNEHAELSTNERPVIGPVLPEGLNLTNQSEGAESSRVVSPGVDLPDIESQSGAEEESYGPALPPELTNEEGEGEEIGPMPATGGEEEEYERRLLMLRYEEKLKADKNKRESWMTELPTKLTKYGLGARNFSKSGVASQSEDRSDWTDTPAEKAIKAKGGSTSAKSTEAVLSRKRNLDRDQQLESKAVELNKTRTESLVDSHQKKRKQDETSGSSTERRPFDRETDLAISKMPSGLSGAKKMVAKAEQLGARFSHGNEQKYL